MVKNIRFVLILLMLLIINFIINGCSVNKQEQTVNLEQGISKYTKNLTYVEIKQNNNKFVSFELKELNNRAGKSDALFEVNFTEDYTTTKQDAWRWEKVNNKSRGLKELNIYILNTSDYYFTDETIYENVVICSTDNVINSTHKFVTNECYNSSKIDFIKKNKQPITTGKKINIENYTFNKGVYQVKVEGIFYPQLGENSIDFIPKVKGIELREFAVFKQGFTTARNYTGTSLHYNLANATDSVIIINITNWSVSRFCVQCPNDLAAYREDNLLNINLSYINNGTGLQGLFMVEPDQAVNNGSTFQVRIYSGDIAITSPPSQIAIDYANIPSRIDWLTDKVTAAGKGDNHINKCNADTQEDIIRNASTSCNFVNTSAGWQHGLLTNATFEIDLDNVYIINQIAIKIQASNQGNTLNTFFMSSLNNLTTVNRFFYGTNTCYNDCTVKFHPVLLTDFRYNGNGGDFANGVPNTAEFQVYRYAGLNYTENMGVETNISMPAPFLNKLDDGALIIFNPSLNWSNISNAGEAYNYRIEVDNNNDFSSPEFKNMSIKEQVNVTGINAINLTFDGNYNWRVTTFGASMNNASKIRSFIFDINQPNVSLSSPPNNRTYIIQNITLNYTIIENNNYTVYYVLDDAKSSAFFGIGYIAFNATGNNLVIRGGGFYTAFNATGNNLNGRLKLR